MAGKGREGRGRERKGRGGEGKGKRGGDGKEGMPPNCNSWIRPCSPDRQKFSSTDDRHNSDSLATIANTTIDLTAIATQRQLH